MYMSYPPLIHHTLTNSDTTKTHCSDTCHMSKSKVGHIHDPVSSIDRDRNYIGFFYEVKTDRYVYLKTQSVFTRLRALDNGIVGQPFLLNFWPFVEDVTSISMLTSPIPSALNLTLCYLNPMYSLTFYRMSLLSSPTHCRSRMVNLPLRATLSEPRWCGHQYKIPYFLVT